MLIRVRLRGPRSSRVDQGAFTALTPVEGIVQLRLGNGTIEIEHDGRVTVDMLRDALAIAGIEIAAVEEDRRTLPTI